MEGGYKVGYDTVLALKWFTIWWYDSLGKRCQLHVAIKSTRKKKSPGERVSKGFQEDSYLSSVFKEGM